MGEPRRPRLVRTSSPGAPGGDGLRRYRVDDFGDVGGLDDVEHAGARGAAVGDGADLGHAVVVDHFRSGPELFDAGARGGDAAAGLAAHDNALDL